MGIRHKAEGSRQVWLSSSTLRAVRISMALGALSAISAVAAQATHPQNASAPKAQAGQTTTFEYQQTTDDLNRRLADINRKLLDASSTASGDYRIGPDDQLDIAVLEATELSRTVRVSASGEVSLALIGAVHATGLTARELELVIEELYRRSYILEPHVSVQVRDMQSHTVAVFGAVKKPGVFQIREAKTLVELLSLAEGLDPDAGDSVIVEHRGALGESGAGQGATSNKDLQAIPPADASGHSAPGMQESLRPAATQFTSAEAVRQKTDAEPNNDAQPGDDAQPRVERVDLKKLLDTGDSRLNVMIYPGDVVKVPRAELVYVVGEVSRPGGFELKSNENISVLQAVALAQGLTHTSAGGRARIIRSDSGTGQRREIPINLSKILAGKTPDPLLEPRDIVFVPNSVGRTVAYRSLDVIASATAGIAVYRW